MGRTIGLRIFLCAWGAVRSPREGVTRRPIRGRPGRHRAVYLSCGMDAAALSSIICSTVARSLRRPGRGLDWEDLAPGGVRARDSGGVEYRIDDSGPEHEKVFTAGGGRRDGAWHRNRAGMNAEQEAAAMAWRALQEVPLPPRRPDDAGASRGSRPSGAGSPRTSSVVNRRDQHVWRARAPSSCSARGLRGTGSSGASSRRRDGGESISGWSSATMPLVVHLGMTDGCCSRRQVRRTRSTCTRFTFAPTPAREPLELRFVDQLTFGGLASSVWTPRGSPAGVPYRARSVRCRFDALAVARRIVGRSSRIKRQLLGSDIVPGIGNIYADEASGAPDPW